VLKSPSTGVLSVCAEVIGVENADSNSLSFRVSNVVSGRFNALTLASTGAATFSSTITQSGEQLLVSNSGSPNLQLRKTGVTDWGSLTYTGSLLQLGTWAGGNTLNITTGGNVGIGTTSPSSSISSNVLGITGSYPGLVLESTGIAKKWSISANWGSGTAFLAFQDETANAERMRITSDGYVRLTASSGGIQFNGDTAAANALDDYEEGTFTPGLTFGGGSTGMTFFDRAGVYTKIGRQVSCTIYLALTAKGSSTGEAILTGLPFTNGNYNRGSQSPASIRFDQITYTGTLQPYLANSSSGIRFQYVTEAGSDVTVTNSNFTDGAEMSITVTYFV
jgi:hypothetical protein